MTVQLSGSSTALPAPLDTYTPLTQGSWALYYAFAVTADADYTHLVIPGNYVESSPTSFPVDTFDMTVSPPALTHLTFSGVSNNFVGWVGNFGSGAASGIAFGSMPYYTSTDPGAATWNLFDASNAASAGTVSVPSKLYTPNSNISNSTWGLTGNPWWCLSRSRFIKVNEYTATTGGAFTALEVMGLDIPSATLIAPIYILASTGIGVPRYVRTSDTHLCIIDNTGVLWLYEYATTGLVSTNVFASAWVNDAGSFQVLEFYGDALYVYFYASGTATDGFYQVNMDATSIRLSDGPLAATSGGGTALSFMTFPYGSSLYCLNSTAFGSGFVMTGTSAVSVQITDAVRVNNTQSAGSVLMLVDALNVAGSPSAKWIQRISDALRMGSAPSVLWSVLQRLDGDITFDDSLEAALRAVIADAVGWADNASAWTSIALTLSERLRMGDSTTAMYDSRVAVAMTFALRSLIVDAQRGYLVDGVSLTESLVQRIAAFAAVLDSWRVAATQSNGAILHAVLTDEANFSESVTDYLAIRQALADGAQFGVTLFTGEDTYVAWVMTPETRAMRRYTNFAFNSFGELNGRLCGANADGLYWLDGDTDDGAEIKASVRTGLLDFGTRQLKRMDRAYLGYTSDGTLGLRVITTSETGDKVEYTYKMVERAASAPREGRIPSGRGMRSVYWQFELVNDAGSNFELHDLTLLPMILSRRIS